MSLSKIRNVGVMIYTGKAGSSSRRGQLIFTADDRKAAFKHFKTCEARWVTEEDRAAKGMMHDLLRYLNCQDFLSRI